MKNIFSFSGKTRIKFISSRKTIYCFDYDGTLSSIVKNPADAMLNESTKNHLINIKKLVPIAIISGRSSSTLRKMLGFEPNYLVGNHGLEGIATSESCLNNYKSISINWLQQLIYLFKNQVPSLEIELEDKEYSLSIHYKNNFAKDKIFEKIFSLNPLPKIIEGKCVLSLLPAQHVNKGTALIDIMKTHKYTHALYAGDDVTDEDVFKIRNLPELSAKQNYPLKNRQLLTLHVGKNLSSQAEYYLENQSDIDLLLNEVYKLLQA